MVFKHYGTNYKSRATLASVHVFPEVIGFYVGAQLQNTSCWKGKNKRLARHFNKLVEC